MGRLDKTPQPVREAIALALFIGAVSATAANMLHQPLFLLGGLILFGVFYFLRINPQVKVAYMQQAEAENKYADDETYQPILDRFSNDKNDDALIEAYQVWKQGPHENEVRLRFLQEAILSLIDEGKIYRVEELMAEVEKLAQAEGLDDRFETFRAECDRRIAEIAQQRLGQTESLPEAEG